VRAALFAFGRVMAVLLALIAGASAQSVRDPENTIFLDVKQGRVVIELRPDLAPRHVERIKELARQKFYDGIVFHRVIEGFMAQTGDPTGSGRGGSGKNLPAEFSREPYVRGTVGMARAQNPNSGDSQFFIMFAPNAGLNGQYTVWGRVIAGMQFVDQIARGEPPREPDRIVRMRVAADVKE
jgi:peptidylprolyl isomerase